MIVVALLLLCSVALGRVLIKAECKMTALEGVHMIDFFWAHSVKEIKKGSIPDAELRLMPLNNDKNHGPLVIPTFFEQGADMILRQPWMSQFQASLWSPDGQILHSDILQVDVYALCKIVPPVKVEEDTPNKRF